MASVKYSLKSDKLYSSVYLRFSVSRTKQFIRKTGIEIPNPLKDWSGVIDNGKFKKDSRGKRLNRGKCMPKQNSEINKALYNRLRDLSSFVLDSYNLEFNDPDSLMQLNSEWLKDKIDNFFNRENFTDNDYIVNFGRAYIENMTTYIKNGIKQKYSIKTKDKLRYLLNHIEEYEKLKGVRLKFIDIDKKLIESLNDFFVEVKGHSTNTRGTNFKKLKTLVSEAEANGISVNPEYHQIKGFTDDRIITTLSFEEIDEIIKWETDDSKLVIAKDWLVIGCFTGQRVSDLHRMNSKMIYNENGYRFIKLTQHKTKKQVHIPITSEVETILNKYKGEFPPNLYENEKSNRAMLSKLFKEVCKGAGITTVVKGRYNGIEGEYPKYKLVSTHTCRRSFASNHYGTKFFTTPQLMEITGHASESNFLLYIGESEGKFKDRNAESFKELEEWRNSLKKERDARLRMA